MQAIQISVGLFEDLDDHIKGQLGQRLVQWQKAGAQQLGFLEGDPVVSAFTQEIHGLFGDVHVCFEPVGDLPPETVELLAARWEKDPEKILRQRR